jgi:hypothetical protein
LITKDEQNYLAQLHSAFVHIDAGLPTNFEPYHVRFSRFLKETHGINTIFDHNGEEFLIFKDETAIDTFYDNVEKHKMWKVLTT